MHYVTVQRVKLKLEAFFLKTNISDLLTRECKFWEPPGLKHLQIYPIISLVSFRWDIQRIREQRMFQRLQQRMNRRKVIQESEPELRSFYPDPEDGMSADAFFPACLRTIWSAHWQCLFLCLSSVESVMVTPFLPVVAFGRPLPNLKQQ